MAQGQAVLKRSGENALWQGQALAKSLCHASLTATVVT